MALKMVGGGRVGGGRVPLVMLGLAVSVSVCVVT